MTKFKYLTILAIITSLALPGVAANAKGDKSHNHGNGNGNGYGHCKHGHGNGYGHGDYDCGEYYYCYDGNKHNCDYYYDGWNDCDWGNLYVTRLSNMRYPTIISGFRQNVVLTPWDANAAVYKVWGIPYSRVRVRVKGNSGYMYSYGNDRIRTTNFTYGGSVDSDGYGYLDRYGFLTNIRIGGTAKVRPRNKDAYYENYFQLEVFYE